MQNMNNHLKTLVLLGGLSALLLAIGGALGPAFFYGFTLLALALNLGAYFFSDRVVLRMHGARALEAHEAPWLHEMVAELAARAAIPKPRLFLIDQPYANAFATGRNPEHGVVAVTRGIVDTLSRRELRGVLAHEIAHIKNRDILVASIAAAIAAAIGYIANAFTWMLFLGGGEEEEGGGSLAGGLLVALVAPIVATLIQLGISRSREYMADATGAQIAADPESLASALERLALASQHVAPAEPQPATASLFIVNPFAGSNAVARLFATHPDTADRVRRLRSMVGTAFA